MQKISGFQITVNCFDRELKKRNYAAKSRNCATVYKAAILELVGNAARENKKDELANVFHGVIIS